MVFEGCFSGDLANGTTSVSGGDGVPILVDTQPYVIRSLVAGSGITITPDGSDIVIARSGGSGIGSDLQDAYTAGNSIMIDNAAPLMLESMTTSGTTVQRNFAYSPADYRNGDLVLTHDPSVATQGMTMPPRISYIEVIFLGYSGSVDLMVRLGIKYSEYSFSVHTHNASSQVPIAPIIVTNAGGILQFTLATGDTLTYTIGATLTQTSLS